MVLLRVCVLALVVIGPPAAARPGQANAGSGKLVHSMLSWTDPARAEPWTADPADHRVLIAHLSYRAEAHTPRPLVLFSTGRYVSPSSYQDLADGSSTPAT